MSLKKKYKEGEVVYLKAPPQASTQNGISVGKCFQRKVDWIIVDEYLENLKQILE